MKPYLLLLLICGLAFFGCVSTPPATKTMTLQDVLLQPSQVGPNLMLASSPAEMPREKLSPSMVRGYKVTYLDNGAYTDMIQGKPAADIIGIDSRAVEFNSTEDALLDNQLVACSQWPSCEQFYPAQLGDQIIANQYARDIGDGHKMILTTVIIHKSNYWLWVLTDGNENADPATLKEETLALTKVQLENFDKYANN
ncbi:MAG: hypothetical protein V1492_02670 [Candidatus Micrarchaeota archaeon]